MRYQILIPHIPHRHEQLIELLDVLAEQMQPGVEVLIYSDNLEVDYAAKCQTLAEAATADYISFLSNDDSVSPNFIPKIMEALEQNPDYVGFRCRYTIDGIRQQPLIHSLRYDGWVNNLELIYRDLTHFNPIRRDLALQVTFQGHLYADRHWADALRALGCVKTEVFIDEEMHYYQWSTGDQFSTHRVPMAAEDIPPLPQYPFVRYIEGVAV